MKFCVYPCMSVSKYSLTHVDQLYETCFVHVLVSFWGGAPLVFFFFSSL